MRKVHFVLGWVTVIAFLITGQVMRHHSPPLVTMGDGARLMYRSRHLYILAAGLVHLMLGVYWQGLDGWRRHAQSAGSAMMVAAVPFLIAAFAVEPSLALRDAGVWSHAGLYALFGGAMLHAICGIRR